LTPDEPEPITAPPEQLFFNRAKVDGEPAGTGLGGFWDLKMLGKTWTKCGETW
jgi:hypothetical protein